MEQKRQVYSMLAEQVVFKGTKDECQNYVNENASDVNSLYIVGDAN